MLCPDCKQDMQDELILKGDGIPDMCRTCFCERFKKNFKTIPGMERMLGKLGGRLIGVAPNLEVLALQTWIKVKKQNVKYWRKKNGTPGDTDKGTDNQRH